MNALLVTVMLVFTPDPSLYCEGPQACAWLKYDGQMNTAFVRGPPSAHMVSLDPDLITFPHFQSNSLHLWRECGEQITSQAGIEVDLDHINQLETICREFKHAIHGESHNQ